MHLLKGCYPVINPDTHCGKHATPPLKTIHGERRGSSFYQVPNTIIVSRQLKGNSSQDL